MFDERLLLTQRGSKNRTEWELPAFFNPDKFQEVKCKDPIQNPDGKWTLKIPGRGQEVYIDDSPDVVSWAIELIKSCKKF